jgi:hypothetical protein
MFRASRCDSDPALSEPVVSVCSRRLRGWGLGWSNCGPVPAQATWATMQVCDSERGQHAPHSAMRCTASHPPASLPTWGETYSGVG